LTEQEERDFREYLAKEVEALGEGSTSVFALLWIKKCADRVRGIA